MRTFGSFLLVALCATLCALAGLPAYLAANLALAGDDDED
jgi:hypothetical protein